MNFSRYLTEAAGEVWVLGYDSNDDIEDTLLDMKLFSTEAKVVEAILDVMVEDHIS